MAREKRLDTARIQAARVIVRVHREQARSTRCFLQERACAVVGCWLDIVGNLGSTAMHEISPSAAWIKAPSADVGVVIVTSAALPHYMIDQLHAAIDDWDQVAYLAVQHSRQLMLDWLQVGSSPEPSTPTDASDAGHLLRGVAKGSFLLDVETGAELGLTWLGSVCGHPLRVVELGAVATSSEGMDQQVEHVLSATRRLAKSLLQERCAL